MRLYAFFRLREVPERVMEVLYWSPVFAALAIMSAITVVYRQPIGVDFNFHLEIARSWARGELGLFHNFELNGIPYPPLLHLLLVPSIWLGVEIPFGCLLQILFLPAAVASLMWFIRSNWGSKAGLIVGTLALGSYAFVDRGMQVIPQAIDFILFPLAIHFSYFDDDWKLKAIVCSLMVYNHGVVAVPLLGGLFLYDLLHKQWKPWLLIAVVCLPLIAVSAPYLVRSYGLMSARTENLQEAQFLANPIVFMLLYQRLVFFGWVVLIYKLWCVPALLHVTTDERIFVLSVFSIMLMALPWGDRFVQYSTIPLSGLIAIFMMKAPDRIRDVLEILSVLAFVFMYVGLWILLALGGYSVG